MRTAARRALLLGAPPLFFLLIAFLAPLLQVFTHAFGAAAGADPARAWHELWTQAYSRNRILFTFQQATLSTLLTLALGLPGAYLLARHRVPGARLLRALFTAPFILPALVVAVALQSFLGRGSLAQQALGWSPLEAAGPLGAILLAHVYYNLSLVIRIVGAALERQPNELHDAARTLGATRWDAFRRVDLPLALPATLSATALVFLFTLTSFGVILILGGETVGTLETLIWDNERSLLPRHDRAALLGLLQLATSLAALLTYLHYRRKTQTQYRPQPDAARPRLRPTGAAYLALISLFLIGPTLTLAHAAFTHQGHWSLDGFRHLSTNAYPLGAYQPLDAISNSLLFGLGALLLAVPLALLTLLALRNLPRARPLTEALFLLPLGLSPVLLGLGFLLAYDGDPFWDLRAHPARILLAHALIAVPFATRILAPSLDAIEPQLRDAARTLGATPGQTFRRLDLPLIRPALRIAAIFAFATSLGEFGATLLLRRPEYTTLPLAIFDALGRPGAAFRAQAEALTLILLLSAALVFWTLELGRRRQGVDIA